MRTYACFVLGLCLLIPAESAAQENRATAQTRPVHSSARSFLHEALLDRAPLIAKVQWDSTEVLDLYEIQMTTFTVLDMLRGKHRSKIVVGAMGPRGTAFKDLEKVLFLKPMQSERMCEVVDLIDLTSKDEKIVPNTVARYLAIGEIQNPILRQRALRELSLRNLDSASTFAARVAVSELLWLIKRAPQVFKPTDVALIRKAERTLPRSARGSFARLLTALEKEVGVHYDEAAKAFMPGPERDLFKQALEVWLAEKDPEKKVAYMDRMVRSGKRRLIRFLEGALLDRSALVRIRAAWWLGELGADESLAALQRNLRTLSTEDVAARITAMGKIGNSDSIPVIRPLMGAEGLLDASLLALARIATPDAQNLLERVAQQLRAKPDEKDRVLRIGNYLSSEFAEEEAARRKLAARSWR